MLSVYEKDWYSLRITDNGAGSITVWAFQWWRGTAQAKSWPDTCEESSRDGLTHLRELCELNGQQQDRGGNSNKLYYSSGVIFDLKNGTPPHLNRLCGFPHRFSQIGKVVRK